ncbi:polar amino acid ABC transporter, inner membrane subunit [Pseudomonas psychrotolerans L19]|uniref:amino acid ABC transporter permease n=1 Tax=Pseudomonas TaxID=286 RepID=UPI00023A3E58|nr:MULTISPECIES: amino acid ABC transporter permease [Pseudomonas]EHK69631.1 polar amino acid ABC transporter, inner membrane subunit [Pseudomonas psychrotolerans L19]MBA1181295.1 amino acid ABC transporter permease [Pseudomonas psychrotolerans]MBA1212935.1 amino acid ABC transporter permease [Pseudomonas psychrotolerans]TCQ88797.1 amino acid ABC transporter membrane protein 1 (PAAT family) [Pseudomonas sp. JUb52]
MQNVSKPSAPVRGSLLTDPQVRSWLFQIVAVVAVVSFGWFLFNNTQTNLANRGITSGFGFLNNTAGFGIPQHLIPYSEGDTYGRVFLVGLLNTLLVSVIGIVLATIIGFTVGVARLSNNWLLRKVATVYIETFRNIPPLLLIFFVYFAVLAPLPGPRQSLSLGGALFVNNRGLYMPAPIADAGLLPGLIALLIAIVASVVVVRWARKRRHATGQRFPVLWTVLALLIGIPLLAALVFGKPLHWELPELQGFNLRGGWVIIPELVSLAVALSVYTAAFIGETVRGGIQAVSHGQTEAASSLGLRPGLTLRLVIIPQALRVIIPPLTNQYLNLMKNSSLGAAVGYPEMVALFAGTTLNQTGQAIETMAITMSVYLAISISISLLMNWYNKRIALIER